MSQIFMGIDGVGGSSGTSWVYKPQSAIKQIIIRHGEVVNSLIFICENGERSPMFGGGSEDKDGDRTDKIEITGPTEYLTGISGSVGKHEGWEVIGKLNIHTNVAKYGRFGRVGGTNFSRSVLVQGGTECSIVGFYGRSGWYLVAIGIYARPL